MILYLIGIIAGLTAFFYIFSLYNSGKEKVVKIIGKKADVSSSPPLPEARLPIFSIPPGERICPLCRSKLSKHEALYASRVTTNGLAKIMIHGCRYCYKEDVNTANRMFG